MEMTRFVMEKRKDSTVGDTRAKPHDRLRKARLDAGFRSASEAARRLGMKPVTYIAHENGGRAFDPEQAEVYARKFKVNPSWLIYGTTEPRMVEAASRGGTVFAARMPTGAELRSESERSEWRMPDDFLQARLRVSPQVADVVVVTSESMVDRSNPQAPHTVFPGDRVILDPRDQFPDPPGVFVVREREGAGLTVRKLRFSHFPSIDVVEVSGNNRDFPTYESPRDELTIYGRIVGRLTSI